MVGEGQKTTIGQIHDIGHGVWLAHANDAVIEELLIDTRKINNPQVSIFIPLKTKLRDGHSFLNDAYEKGVRNFIVSEAVDAQTLPGANIIQVKDTLAALQQIAAAHRKQFNIPVIGITGSNGKTVVKEWLYQLLSPFYNTVRSPKSYNSQIGVPLSVWLLRPGHTLGIFEAGISQPGEMEQLERIIQPTIGIFTNIGEAHSEGFLNMRQKINEKLFLFRSVKHLIYCHDHLELNECIVQYMHQVKGGSGDTPLKLFTWSEKQDAGLRITEQKKDLGKTTITGIYEGKENSITIPFTDHAAIENAIHCWCAMLLLGISTEKIKKGMIALQPVSMRLELRQGINGCTVINDSYNSDLTSLQIALSYLAQQTQHRQHTVILSDMLQLGKPDVELYEEVATLISQRNISRFIGIGPALYKNKTLFRKYRRFRSIFFKSTEDFLKNFHHITFDKEAVLLKGARVFAFEKIDMLLEQKIHQTVMSINLSALTHNLNVFRSHIGPEVKTMAMVKAFAYGSGSNEIAGLLQYVGVNYLSVAYTDEGIGLRKAGITMPIMVMSPDAISFDRMIAWTLEPEIFNFRSLHSFIGIAQNLGINNYPIHIKLDTGMHRLGFLENEIAELMRELEQYPHIHVASIFSHLVASEDPAQDKFTKQQAALFEQMSGAIIQRLPYKPLCHLCNSAGIARHPGMHYDMVRIGLGLYGIESSGTLQNELKQISTLKTTIAQIKKVPAGETIGYGRKALAGSDMTIATLCIGYADGYQRALTNGNPYVLIHGKPAPVTGVIAMDMCMADITDIPDAVEGDEAIIFSPELPVTQLATWAGTIPYEIMTGISQRVKRVYVNEE